MRVRETRQNFAHLVIPWETSGDPVSEERSILNHGRNRSVASSLQARALPGLIHFKSCDLPG